MFDVKHTAYNLAACTLASRAVESLFAELKEAPVNQPNVSDALKAAAGAASGA